MIKKLPLIYKQELENKQMIKQKPLKIKYNNKNGVTLEEVHQIRTPNFYDIF